MALQSCWISDTREMPDALRKLTENGWSIRTCPSPNAGADILFCDHRWPKLAVLCGKRRHDDGVPPVIVVGQMYSSEKAGWIALGADDAVPPDCSAEEMAERAKRHAEKSAVIARAGLYGAFSFRYFERTARFAGNGMDLNDREYMLLLYLARASGKIVSRTELLQKIWGLDFDPGTNRVEVHIFRLREKLRQFGARSWLETHKGKGYSLRTE